MNSAQIYKVIGLMSGTSLDGVDIAYCTFTFESGWTFVLEKAETIPYPAKWETALRNAHTLSSEKLLALDVAYGTYLGSLCQAFIKKNKIKTVHFIASHGHTVFHQPEKIFTCQIGNGNALHAATSLPVISDFRSLDVLYGGQGAPLVPAGDKHLFDEYDVCLNLGGIANLSLEHKKKRIAFDVCFLNMGLNHLAKKVKRKYDAGGKLASQGTINQSLLTKINKVYDGLVRQRPSLGRELFERKIQPLLDNDTISVEDKLCTFCESVAQQIISAVKPYGGNKTVLCTGGGAFNSFLMYRLVELGGDNITFVLPEEEVINFKEALVFAFLGVMRMRNEANCLQEVTGAKRSSSSGVMIGF